MTLYTADTLDLSRIGAPTVAEVDYEASVARLKAEFLRLWAQARVIDPSLPDYSVETLETDPAIILIQDFAFGDTLLRAAINDAANALRLAKATGADLDHIANTYHNTGRLVLDAGDATANPPREPLYESDAAYRGRAQLALEAYPLHGLTPGGYVYRVKKLFGDVIKEVRAIRRGGGRLDVVLLARAGDGTVPQTTIGDLQALYESEDASACTDIPTVVGATIVATPVRIVLGLPPGPDAAPVIEESTKAVATLAAERHRIGETLHVQALGAVAKVGGARYARVELPVSDISGGDAGAPFVSSIQILWEAAIS